MTDRVDPATRSRIMASVSQRDTKPECEVRSLLHRLGYRFRITRDDLPGRPDIVLPKYKAAILVHGCFWHQHDGCRRAKRPTSNTAYWSQKLNRNIQRDKRAISNLESLGWRVLVIWECDLRCIEQVEEKIETFLDTCSPTSSVSGL